MICSPNQTAAPLSVPLGRRSRRDHVSRRTRRGGARHVGYRIRADVALASEPRRALTAIRIDIRSPGPRLGSVYAIRCRTEAQDAQQCSDCQRARTG